MSFRYCIPVVTGKGAGLGNELIPWARAYLSSKVLNATCLKPAFGLNRFGYKDHFGTPSLDWIWNRILARSLPVFDFNEEAYLKYGGDDVVSAIREFALAHSLCQRRLFVVTTSGMWGGMRHIEAARSFVLSTLYLSRFASKNLLMLNERMTKNVPLVGMHVRLGDFAAEREPSEYKGVFNVSLPISWFRRVAESIYSQLNGKVQFLVVSDADQDRLFPLTNGLPCILTKDMARTDCSDLLALAGADLLVCSVSSYSVWASFLSDAPYLWYGPQLTEHPGGWFSIWGYETRQNELSGGTQVSLSEVRERRQLNARAWAVPASGDVPWDPIEVMLQRRWDRSCDLVRYGVVNYRR